MTNTTIYPYGTDGQLPSSIGVINDLTTGGDDKALSAEMGKTLAEQIAAVGTTTESNDNADLDIEDEDGNVILRLNGGHIQTKNFNSEQVVGGEGKSISILFIGNSLTQDAVSYVPLVLKEIAPALNFKLFMWYDSGRSLYGIYNKFINNNAAEIFSTCDNGTSWTNTSKTMSTFLSSSGTQFDIVCLEEYFNYKLVNNSPGQSSYGGDPTGQGYTQTDKDAFNNIVEYIRSNYGKPFKVVSFFHRPRSKKVNNDTQASASAVCDAVFDLTKQGVTWQLQNTVSEGVIPAGIAAYRAMSVSEFNGLGDNGHMTVDNTHAQEGLPCLMQAWVVAMWIFDQLGIPASINNAQARVTNDNYASINVPGANLGSGVVVGTTEQDRLAMDVAIAAFKEGKKIEINALIGQDNNG